MCLGQRVIQPGALFEFLAIDGVLAKQHVSGVTALGPQCIDFENEFSRPSNRQLDVIWFLQFLHAQRMARLGASCY